jgi:hypothetical protein
LFAKAHHAKFLLMCVGGCEEKNKVTFIIAALKVDQLLH